MVICSDIQNHDTVNIVNSTVSYILDSKRFGCSLMYCKAPLSVKSSMEHVSFTKDKIT